MVANVTDRMVDQVGAEMIAVARLQMNRPIVLIELGIPLISQRTVEPVPSAESAPQRQTILRSC